MHSRETSQPTFSGKSVMLLFCASFLYCIFLLPIVTADIIYQADFDGPTTCSDESWQVFEGPGSITYGQKNTYQSYGAGQSWWLGAEQGESFWTTPPGYGNYWSQTIELPSIDLTLADNPSISYFFQTNIDGQDKFYLEIYNQQQFLWETFVQFDGSNGGWMPSGTFNIDPSLFGPNLSARFRLESGSSGSDEDFLDGDGVFVDEILIFDDGNFNGSDFLVWEPDPTPQTGATLVQDLTLLGYRGEYTTNIMPYTLGDFSLVIVLLGHQPSSHLIPENQSEAMKLVSYLEQGGKMFLEGGDVWAHDPQYGGEDLAPYFGLIADDGQDGVQQIIGEQGTWTEGMIFSYSGDNISLDNLTPFGDARLIFTNAGNAGIAIANEGMFGEQTLATSFSYAGLVEENTLREELAQSIMNYFGIKPSRTRENQIIYYNNAGDTTGIGPDPHMGTAENGNWYHLNRELLTSCTWSAQDPSTNLTPHHMNNTLLSPVIDTFMICANNTNITVTIDAYVDAGLGSTTLAYRDDPEGTFIQAGSIEGQGMTSMNLSAGNAKTQQVQLAITQTTMQGPETRGTFIDNVTMNCELNHPPQFNTFAGRTVRVGSILEFVVTAMDIDADTLRYATNAAGVLSSAYTFDEVTGRFSWTPRIQDVGTYTVEFVVNDGIADDMQNMTITVIPRGPGGSPIFAKPPNEAVCLEGCAST